MREDIKKTIDAVAEFLPALMSGVQLEFFAKNNITNSQFITLMAIHHSGRCTMSRLAQGLHVAMPTVTGLIDRLIKSDLVTRVAGQEDRRQVYVELSAKGQKLIKDFKGVVRHRWGGLLSALEPDEVRAYGGILEKLSGHIKRQKEGFGRIKEEEI